MVTHTIPLSKGYLTGLFPMRSLLLSKLRRCISAERPTPLTARPRSERAVKGDRRASRQRVSPLTAARTERLSIVQSLITQILASRNLEQRLVPRKKEVFRRTWQRLYTYQLSNITS